VHLAAIQLQDLLVIGLFIVVPLALRVFQSLQKKRAEAEARERMRQRRAGLEPASTSAADEPPARGGLLERLEALVGEAQAETTPEPRPAPGPAPGPASGPELVAETFWGDLAPEFAPAPAPEPTPRRVAPATEARQPVAQISDFASTSLAGLGAMAPGPREDDVEAGRIDYGVLTTLSGLDDDGDPLQPLVDLPELGAPSASRASAPGPRARRARAVGFRGEQNWRRAIVLSEVLGPPVSLRDPGGFAPGLNPWTS
jgi:hypothetical protein